MTYLKTILAITLFCYLFICGIIIGYDGIQYNNLIYIISPILLVIITYIFFTKRYKKIIDFNFYSIRLNFPLALFLLTICVVINIKNLNFTSLFQGNYAEIRGEYLDKLDANNVSSLEQLVPLLSIYPLSYLLYAIATNKNFNLKIIIIILGLLTLGQTTGGRQIIFQIFVLILGIKGISILKNKASLLFLGGFVLLATIVTIGRYDNPDVDKAKLLENLTPAKVNPYFKNASEYKAAKDVAIEVSFYFGQSVPAFCNEIENMEVSVFPQYIWGMQPFLERQFFKIGVVKTEQRKRWQILLDLADNSGFFPGTWTTGFLDIYFNLGVIGTIIFCGIVGFLLSMCQMNLKAGKDPKYYILNAFNILFLITTFMAPAYFDTTIIFTYVFLLFGKIS